MWKILDKGERLEELRGLTLGKEVEKAIKEMVKYKPQEEYVKLKKARELRNRLKPYAVVPT